MVSAKVRNIIGSELLSIYDNRTSPSLPSSPFFIIQNGYVLIDVIVNPGFYSTVLNLLQTAPYGLIPPYGLNYFPNGQSGFIITGQFPIVNLLKLNLLQTEINYCRTHYQAFSNSGLVTTAGDTTMRSYLVRSGYSVDGTGIKIGVISDSYNTIPSGTTATLPLQPIKIPPFIISPLTLDTIGTLNPVPQTFNTNTAAQDISNGDLPVVNVLLDFPVQRSDEGRGMMQIIHDVAPGAELYFRTGFFTANDFAVGIKQLRDAGCKIIVDDVTYITEPFLKDGVVAKTVDTVTGDGVSYFSAAGNFAKRSYEKNFNPLDITSLGFPGLKAHNFGGGDVFQHVRLAPGNYTFVLQWVDNIFSSGETEGTVNDVDIFLTPNTDGSGLIGYNRDNTDGDPIEFIPITIGGTDSVDYNIFIVNNTLTSNPSRIKYIVFRGGIRFMEFNEGTSTLVGQANSLGAIAIGAARFNHVPGHPLLPATLSGITEPKIESFSSLGGTWVNGVPRQKPDLTGPDGGNTTVRLGQDYPDWVLDGFSNFFGTSASAPHAAAAAALIMEGRKTFIAGHPETSPAEIRSLLQQTAVDMESANNIAPPSKFDYISGYGLINADSAMRTFAAPTPFQIQLVVPPNVIPGESEFTLIITGQNFSNNTVIYLDDSVIETQFVNKNELTAVIGPFENSPEVKAFTEGMTEFGDGGFSNSLFFFDANIVIQAVNVTKQYGQSMPALDTIITINGKLLQDTSVTLADIGLTNLTLQTNATVTSDVGTYVINVSRVFDPNIPADFEFLKKYNYTFINGAVTINQMPVTVVPNNQTIVSGQLPGNITYSYLDANGALITDPFLLNALDSSHHQYMPDNVLAVVSGFPGSPALTDADLQNMSGMVSFQSVINSRKFQFVNGELVPLPPNSSSFNVQYLVDVSAQSILNFKTSSPLDDILVSAYPNVHSRAMINAGALMNGTARSGVDANSLVHMVNGELVPMVNSDAGELVPIVNGELVQLVNGVKMELVNGELVPMVNGELVQLVNGEWMRTVNGELVPLINGELVQLVNGELVQLVNGELVPLINGELVQLVNASADVLVQMLNGELVQLINGELVPLVNGELVQLVNGELVQLVNGELVPLINGELVQLINGELVQLVNGELVHMVNGTQLSITNDLVQIVNGELVQLINGELVPLINGELVQLVNGELVQLVNSYSAGPGNNEKTAVIIDSDDIALQNGFVGAMFSTNIISGLGVGQQTFISGMLANSNFAVTYKVGKVTITPNPCLLTHGPFKNFGNTANLPTPTSLWLNLVTKVSGQLTAPGDFLLFKNGSVTFNFISSTPTVTDLALPDGKIVVDNTVSAPVTHYDSQNNIWITRVPVGFASTSDIFVTGGIINSSTGFIKMNGNTNSVVKGMFFSNKSFNDQWAYAIAAYQPQFTFAAISQTRTSRFDQRNLSCRNTYSAITIPGAGSQWRWRK